MQPFTRVSEDEYLDAERRAGTKHELVNGQVLAMAGGSIRHNAMVARLLMAFGTRLRGRDCFPLASDQRVHVPATGLYAYPDVSVICGSAQVHSKDAQTIVNPKVIVEVLSESTEAYDRGAKFAHYRSIESLQTYIMVNTTEERIERFERGAAGTWTLQEAFGTGALLAIPALGFSVPLAELYEALPG